MADSDFLREMEMRSQLVQQALTSMEINNKSLSVAWSAQATLYSNWWYWYDDKALEQLTGAKKDKLLFPLKLNPIRWVAHKHASGLFGEVAEDSADSLVGFRYRNMEGKTDPKTASVENTIATIWAESNGAEIQAENALISQVLGGCVFKVGYWPDPLQSFPYRITSVMPDFFYPIWDSEDKWKLHEAFVGYYITPEEAYTKYGVKVSGNVPRTVYVEHWTKEKFEIRVDGKVPRIYGSEGVSTELRGVNKYGFVPFVYIPHRYRAGMYYGKSHTPGLIGIVEEINARMADRGDKIRIQSQDVNWAVNVRASMQERDIAGRKFIMLGNSMPDGKSEPKTGVLETSSAAESAGHQFTSDLWEMIQHESDTPGVSWGQDEGSQRSSATLEVRFWPFLNHMRSERVMWSQGLKIVNKMLLRMMITDELLGKDVMLLKPGIDWAEILPRERADKVQEIIQRRSAKIISRKNALLQLSRGEDIEEELKLIEQEDQAERDANLEQAKIQAEAKASQTKEPSGKGGASDASSRSRPAE